MVAVTKLFLSRSIPPEQLLRAHLLQPIYGIRRADADGPGGLQPAVPLV